MTSVNAPLFAKLAASAMSAINLSARPQPPLAALALNGRRVSPWITMRPNDANDWFASFTTSLGGAAVDAIWFRPGPRDVFQYKFERRDWYQRGDRFTFTWHTELTPVGKAFVR